MLGLPATLRPILHHVALSHLQVFVVQPKAYCCVAGRWRFCTEEQLLASSVRSVPAPGGLIEGPIVISLYGAPPGCGHLPKASKPGSMWGVPISFGQGVVEGSWPGGCNKVIPCRSLRKMGRAVQVLAPRSTYWGIGRGKERGAAGPTYHLLADRDAAHLSIGERPPFRRLEGPKLQPSQGNPVDPDDAMSKGCHHAPQLVVPGRERLWHQNMQQRTCTSE